MLVCSESEFMECSFSDAVSHVTQLLVWMCVVSGGLHQDTHRVAADP